MNELAVKCILLGGPSVGKTSMVHYLLYDTPLGVSTTTVGANHSRLDLSAGEVNFVVSIWDPSGQTKFASTIPLYIRDTNVALIIIDSTDVAEGLLSVDRYLKQIDHYAPSCVTTFVINKCDLVTADETKEQIHEITKFITENWPDFGPITIIPCSALEGTNINTHDQPEFTRCSIRAAIVDALDKQTESLRKKKAESRPKLVENESKKVNPCCQ